MIRVDNNKRNPVDERSGQRLFSPRLVARQNNQYSSEVKFFLNLIRYLVKHKETDYMRMPLNSRPT